MKFREMYDCDAVPEKVDTETLTIPDTCPSLREIVMSGNITLVGGEPMYDKDVNAGLERARLQKAPIEEVLAPRFAALDAYDDESEAESSRGGKDQANRDNDGSAQSADHQSAQATAQAAKE